MENELFCKDCKMMTDVVWDHASGDIICTQCALVLESHCIDDTPEWRIFSDESHSNNNGPVRVGEPTTFTTALLEDPARLSTIISSPNNAPNAAFSPWKELNQTKRSSYLIAGFTTIADMADRLGLATTIKYRASELYKKAEDQKHSRGRNHDAIMAACLYIACSQENRPRSAKEICSVTNGIKVKEILRAKTSLVKRLEVEMGHVGIGTIQAGDFLRRFCSHLGMSNTSVKAAQEAVENIQKSDKFDIRRNPTSIVAAIIYIIMQLSKDKMPTPIKVVQSTIRSTCRDLYPHISAIIPTWFANREDLSKLCRPQNA